ncbi:MAG: hypothetical protein JRJ59_02370 [Deltaproteobacteria bacterium]|nr:hypothetical protein [Deltaproteobacteria bacterium]
MGRLSAWPKTPARFCLLLFVGGLLYSGLFNTLNKSYLHVYSDARAYFLTGKNLAHGLGYTEGERNFWRDSVNRVCPLYIASLAGLFYIMDSPGPWRGQNEVSLAETKIILVYQTVLYALGAILAYLIARRIWEEATARWVGVLSLLIPDFVSYAGMVMSEPLGLALLLAAAWFLLAYLEKMDRPGLALAAFWFLGLTVLVRPNLLLPALLAAVYMALKGRLKTALLGAALLVLILTPFTVRNLNKFGRPWFATSILSYNVMIGNAGSTGEMVMDEDEIDRRLGLSFKKSTLAQVDDASRRELWRLVKEEPGHLAAINVIKFFRFWSVFRTAANEWMNNNIWWKRAQLAVSSLTNSWLFILGPIGLALPLALPGASPRPRRAMLFYVGLVFVTTIPMYLNHRHRFILFPFLLMGAVALSRHLWLVWRPRLKAAGLKGLWASLDAGQRRWLKGGLVWAGFVWGGSLFDGIMRFERFLNYVIGRNVYF